MTKFSDLKNKWMQDPAFRAEYEALEDEFRLADVLIRARVAADMTQADVAKAMHTSQSYIARLEGGSVIPSFKALQRFAKATGTRLRINFEHPQ